MFALTRLSFAFGPGGNVEKKIVTRAFTLNYYDWEVSANVFRFVLELFYILFLVYYISEEAIEVVSDYQSMKQEAMSAKSPSARTRYCPEFFLSKYKNVFLF